MLSDLSFADLVLWVREYPHHEGDDGWVAVAHCRPSRGPTVYYDHLVGTRSPTGRREQLDRAWTTRRVIRDRDPEWHEDVPVRAEALPVVRGDRVLAGGGRHPNPAAARTPSRLELTYLQCADDLARMIAAGAFPVMGAPTGPRRGAPRGGGGRRRPDRDGAAVHAPPH